MHLFHVKEYQGELISDCDEGELIWVEKSRIGELRLWQGDLIFLKLMEERKEFFNLKLIYKGEELVSAVIDGREELI